LGHLVFRSPTQKVGDFLPEVTQFDEDNAKKAIR
jgi:hypothetical protein